MWRNPVLIHIIGTGIGGVNEFVQKLTGSQLNLNYHSGTPHRRRKETKRNETEEDFWYDWE